MPAEQLPVSQHGYQILFLCRARGKKSEYSLQATLVKNAEIRPPTTIDIITRPRLGDIIILFASHNLTSPR